MTTLNCTLCKFNRYFADNYADICFLKKERPGGYEFMEDYKKFSSCDYCFKTWETGEEDYICNTCFNNIYEFYIDNKYDKGNCTPSYNDNENCNSFINYRDIANN